MSIEALCSQFLDVPKNIIIKTEALRLGICFSQAALDAVKQMDVHFTGYFGHAYSFDKPVAYEERIPFQFFLKSDDAVVSVRRNLNSPYVVDWHESKFWFCDETGPIEEVYFSRAPKWLHHVFEDGTPMQAIIQPVGLDGANTVNIDVYCEFWKTGEQCLYCDIVSFMQDKRREKLKFPALRLKPIDKVARGLGIAMKESGFRHISISSGSIVDKRDGKTETEWLIDYLNRINEELPYGGLKRWDSMLQILAKPKDEVKMLHDTGVGSLQFNMEVWDEGLFKIICPGKARLVGRDGWIKRLVEAVDIFGRGRIFSNFVTGVEMCQQYGFKNVTEAVNSTLSGFDYLMSHGVMPRENLWTPALGSKFGVQPPVPLEYYIELHRGWTELRQKHDVSFPLVCYCHSCSPHCLFADWDYYFGERQPNVPTQAMAAEVSEVSKD